MKPIRFFLALALLVSQLSQAQTAATPRPKPERFAKDIAAFAKQEAAQGGIVFTGSSSIRRWTTLSQDFPDLPVLNRGFGGSVANDLIVYADTVVFRHAPKILVTYTGSNDLNARLSPQEALEDYTRFLDLVHAKLPATKVILTSVKISLKRVSQIPQVEALNKLLENWAKNKPWVRYVDCTRYLADDQGQPIRRFFVDDLLHLSPEGYAEWTKILSPILHEEWAKVQSR
jgi:lysophospholipase L1-like esterase